MSQQPKPEDIRPGYEYPTTVLDWVGFERVRRPAIVRITRVTPCTATYEVDNGEPKVVRASKWRSIGGQLPSVITPKEAEEKKLVWERSNLEARVKQHAGRVSKSDLCKVSDEALQEVLSVLLSIEAPRVVVTTKEGP